MPPAAPTANIQALIDTVEAMSAERGEHPAHGHTDLPLSSPAPA